MRIKWGLYSGLLILSGCLTSDGLSTLAQSQTNITSLTLLRLGMDEGEVLQIMHAPHSEETYTVGQNQYDVYFYITSPTVLGQTRMVHANLTPLTFKNDILVSGNWAYYKWVKEQVRLAQMPAPQVPPAPPTSNGQEQQEQYQKILTQPPENEDVDKALNQPAGATMSTAPENSDIEKALNQPSSGTVSGTVTGTMSTPPPQQPQQRKAQPRPATGKGPCPSCPGLLEASLILGDSNEKQKPKEVDINEEDQEMLQQEQEQDFNFW
jgi:hypothetical protein